MINVRRFLDEKAKLTEAALEEYFERFDSAAPEPLIEAMRYSLFAGGKRLRPALALGACEIVSGDDKAALPAACALEMIHTYSLIHDDLPAMDDDALRRGKPTNHVVYGEAMAILAGDGLLTMAFDVAAMSGRSDVVAEIAWGAGVAGMVGGQVLDMDSEEKDLTVNELQRIHHAKTGALIRAAVRSGGMLGGADPEQLDALTRYGRLIGLAFQIADDVLDVTGTEEALGKPVGSDVKNVKSTYPGLLGVDESRQLARQTIDEAVEVLEPFGADADPFRAIAWYIIEREG